MNRQMHSARWKEKNRQMRKNHRFMSLFDTLDKNGDETLDYQEFERFIRKEYADKNWDGKLKSR